MGNNGSVAPKERVNIVYKPATGEMKESVELPLRMVVMGDLTQKPDDRSLEEREMVEVGKNNFADVMRGLDLSVDLSVPEKLPGKGDGEIDISLKFETLKDFAPDSIAQQVPELRKIIELRTALMAVKGPLGNIPALRKTIQESFDNDEERMKLEKELNLKRP